MSSRFNSSASHAAYHYGAETYMKGYEAAIDDMFTNLYDDLDDETMRKIHISLHNLRIQMKDHLESYKEKK